MNQRPAATSIRGAVLLALGCTLALAVTLPSTVAGSDSGWQVQLGPDSDLCPRYLADPRLPVFGLKALSFSDSEVPDANESDEATSQAPPQSGGGGSITFHYLLYAQCYS